MLKLKAAKNYGFCSNAVSTLAGLLCKQSQYLTVTKAADIYSIASYVASNDCCRFVDKAGQTGLC